jgi:DNA-binding protein HU-beta
LFSGCSVAWLARLFWEQEVAGSNPATPTIFPSSITDLQKWNKSYLMKFNLFSEYPLEVNYIMARMTQTEIVASLADKAGLKKTDVKGLFDALSALATNEVKTNGEFTLPGFGKLVKATRAARDGRNPATGAVIKIPAKTTVKFRVGKAMKDAIG